MKIFERASKQKFFLKFERFLYHLLKLDTDLRFRWILTEDFKFWIKSNIILT